MRYYLIGYQALIIFLRTPFKHLKLELAVYLLSNTEDDRQGNPLPSGLLINIFSLSGPFTE